MLSVRSELPVNASRVIAGTASDADPCRVGCVDNPNARILRVVHVSDTRSNNESLTVPAGDILIHSGNFFSHDSCKDFCQNVADLDQFFASQPHRYKVVISSSHLLLLIATCQCLQLCAPLTVPSLSIGTSKLTTFAKLFYFLRTSLLAPLIQHLLTLHTFINFT